MNQSIPVIDSHHHLWQYSPEAYPWIPLGSALQQDFLLAQLQQLATTHKLSGSIAVQARQSIAETDWLLSLAENSSTIRGVVGWLPLASDEIEPMLESYSRQPHLVGLRHVLQEEPTSFFHDKNFNHGLSRLAQTRLRYDLLVFEHQLDDALQLIDRHPTLPFVVDHIAKPVIHRDAVSAVWQKGMQALAERDNVIGVKLSGMVTEVLDAELCWDTLLRYVDASLALFGTERLLYGSDWPVSLLRIDDYGDWLDFVKNALQSLTREEQLAIFSENCQRCYQLTGD